MPGAGALTERMTFQRRAENANGHRLGDWETQFSRPAAITYLRGGEQALEQRLQGVQPVVLTVRKESLTEAIDNSWRVIDARDSTRSFDIKSAAPAKDRKFIDILAEMKIGHDAS